MHSPATRFSGNPATVVLDADGQSDATMASFAREFSHAEVAFVSAATAADHDVRVRFFNARKEAPFVGHATLAAHAVLLALGRRGTGRVHARRAAPESSRCSARSRASAGSPLIEFRQTVPELDEPLPFKTTLRVAEALRLPATSLDEMMPARIARKGSSRLLVPVGDARALEGLAPNFETLLALGRELGAEGFFVFSVNREARPRAGDDHRVAHVLPGARHHRGSGERQRARDARRLPLRDGPDRHSPDWVPGLAGTVTCSGPRKSTCAWSASDPPWWPRTSAVTPCMVSEGTLAA